MNEKQKKILIIVALLCIVYVIIMLVFFGKEEETGEDNLVFLLNPDTQITYIDDIWTRSSPSSTDDESYYKVYDDNKYVGTYHMMHNKYIDGYNIFNDQKNYYTVEANHFVLGIRSSKNISVISTETINVTDDDYFVIKTVLNQKGINCDINDLYKKKVRLDYDNDGNQENIYMITNAFQTEGEFSNAFSIIFIEKKNKIEIIHQDIQDKDNIYDVCVPYVQNVVDIEGDKNYSIIFGCEYYSNMGTCHMLYGIKDKKYQMILAC